MINKTHFIFDIETNGFANCSVLSISFIICKEDKILDKQTRYYFPKENYYNKQAIAVNGLKKEVIKNHREDINYPLYFEDNYDWLVNIFNKFNINNIVAHNTSFDLKFLPNKLKAKIENQEYSTFCTMQENKSIMPNNKAPKLTEACEKYSINFDMSKAHSSDYDTLKCYEVFIKTMKKRNWR